MTKSLDISRILSQSSFIFLKNISGLICNTLGKDDTRYLVDVISTLYARKERIGDYLTVAKDDFEESTLKRGAGQIDWRKWNRIPKELLPTLKHLKGIAQAPNKPLGPELGIDASDKEGAKETKKTCSEKDQFTKLFIGIGVLMIGILVVIGSMIALVTYITAANRGQIEVRASNYSICLDFRTGDYDRPPTPPDNMIWGEEIRNSRD